MNALPEGFSWTPPSSPDHRDYKEIWAFIEQLKKENPLLGMAWFAAVAEADSKEKSRQSRWQEPGISVSATDPVPLVDIY